MDTTRWLTALFIALAFAIPHASLAVEPHFGDPNTSEDDNDALALLAEHVVIGLEAEVQVFYEERGKPNSGFAPGDVGLTILGRLGNGVDAHVLIRFEDEDEEEQRNLVEEAYFSLEYPQMGPVFLDMGRMAMPVTENYSRFSTDSAVLTIGQTTEKDGLAMGVDTDHFTFMATTYAGETGPDAAAGVEQIDEAVFYTSIDLGDVLELGGYWTSDIGESDVMSEDVLIDARSADEVEGWGSFLSIELGGLSLDSEFIGSLNQYRAGLLDNRPRRLSPWAWYSELAWDGELWTLAGRYEESHETLNSPERQFGILVGRDLSEFVTVAAEYLHGELRAGGSPRDIANLEMSVNY